MQGYILAVCGAIILSALVSILLPEGRIGKFIGGIMKVFCVLVMLLPLYELVSGLSAPEPEEGATESSVELDEDFIDGMFAERAQAQAEDLELALAEDPGIAVCAEVLWERVEYSYTVREVRVKIENFGIYGEDEHIFVIEQVEERVSELMGNIPEVVVYE